MDLGPFGYKAKDNRDEYEMEKERQSRLSPSRPFFEEEDKPVREVVKEVRIHSRDAVPRWGEDDLEPLKRSTPEIVGSLFDRVKFLEERITDIQNSIKLREELHRDMIEEIKVDMQEKESMAGRAIDLDEQRNLKLDMSLLRKEKRAENMRFWKDLMELKAELKELQEAHQNEVKIAALFGKEDDSDEATG